MKPESFEVLKLTIVDDVIAVLTIDLPKKRNALNTQCHYELLRFALELSEDPQLRCGIITATDKKVFISGNDVTEFHEEGFWPDNCLRTAINAMEDCRKPIIAAVNGHAIGGGLELALAADICILSENATFSLPETGIGIIPGACGIQRLARSAGTAVAKEMALTGRRMSAEEAVTRGLALKAVPQETLYEEAVALARKLAVRAPLALEIAKKAANSALNMDIRSAQLLEEWGEQVLIHTEDKDEGIAAFAEKRSPVYKGK